jgi:hypothetical protein
MLLIVRTTLRLFGLFLLCGLRKGGLGNGQDHLEVVREPLKRHLMCLSGLGRLLCG